MKKYLTTLFIGGALFLIGIAILYIETINYDTSLSLTSNLNYEQEVLQYEINNDQTFRITNDGTNKNMKLYIDNSLSNEIRILVVHPDIIEIESDYNTKNNYNAEMIMIDLESKMLLDWNTVESLYDLGILSLKNRTIYNYTLLEYPEIRIFVNENYRNNIEFIDNNGKIYNPIG